MLSDQMPEAPSRTPIPCDPMQALTERNKWWKLTSFCERNQRTINNRLEAQPPCVQAAFLKYPSLTNAIFLIVRVSSKIEFWFLTSLGSQAGEGSGIARVNRSTRITSWRSTGCASVSAFGSTASTGSVAASTTEPTITSATSGGSIPAATATTETATSAALGSLNEALVNLKNLLLLTLTFALGLATGSSDEVLLLILVNWLGVGPLLILLATLVWLAGLRDTSAKLKLLLGKCGKVIGVGDAIILWFGLGLCISWRNLPFLLFCLGNSLTSLLILQFSIAFVCAPAMGDLLLRVTVVVRKRISVQED
jgi:hypothetical protein